MINNQDITNTDPNGNDLPTCFDIVYVDNSTLFFGDKSDDNSCESSDTRPVSVNWDRRYDKDSALSNRTLKMIVHAGQSLSAGGGASAYRSNPEAAIISKEPEYPEHTLMFNTGSRGVEWDVLNENTLTYFTGIHESFDGIRLGETQGSGMLEKLQTLFIDEGEYSNIWLYRSHGSGGKAYKDIKKGTSTYQNGMKEVQRAVDISQRHGWDVEVVAIFITHGGQDSTDGNQQYDTDLAEFIADYRADIPEITGQSSEIKVVIDQRSLAVDGNLGSKVMMDQLNVTLATPETYLSQPRYQYDYIDNVHLTPEGYRLLGEKQATILKKILDGEDFKPLYPTSVTRTDADIDITLNIPMEPLMFDTTLLPAQPNMGFVYHDDVNSAIIQSVSIISNNTIRITLNNVPSGTNKSISYAWRDTIYRGNVRDSDPTTSIYGDGLAQPNWLVAFSLSAE